MEAPVFEEAPVGEETGGGVREGQEGEGRPEVAAEGGWDGVFAQEGELVEGGVGLGLVSWGFGGGGCGGFGRGGRSQEGVGGGGTNFEGSG